MKNFIQKKLDTVYEDFLDAAKNSNGLCALKNFSFAGGGSPDYSDPLVRKYYLLKYFPAYLAEYYLMYGALFNYNFLPQDDLTILSLGCGCGIDYWGFYFYLKNNNMCFNPHTSYTGIDLNNWEYIDNLGNSNIIFKKQDIGKIQKLQNKKYNIIVFPKSISDFPEEKFSIFLNAIRNTKLSRDRISILCSFMTNNSSQYDFNKMHRFISELTNTHKYTIKEQRQFRLKEKDVGLIKIVPQFSYTLDISSTIAKTLENCPNYIKNEKSCDNQCHTMNKWPILKSNYVNFAICNLER